MSGKEYYSKIRESCVETLLQARIQQNLQIGTHSRHTMSLYAHRNIKKVRPHQEYWALEPSAQERHGLVGVVPEEGHKNSQMD